jgi:hypothetical protein
MAKILRMLKWKQVFFAQLYTLYSVNTGEIRCLMLRYERLYILAMTAINISFPTLEL